MNTNDNKQILWPEDAKAILDRIKPEHLKMIGLDKTNSNPSNMIIDVLAVAPPPVRPSVAMSNSLRSEDDLTIAYTKIVKCNNELRDNRNKGAADTQIR